MRYTQDHKAQTRERILQEASARFRRDGIGATGLQPLMKALGLTHGGFYAHFKSKDELVEEALRCAADEASEYTRDAFSQEQALAAFVDLYLSETHRDTPEKGCPLPTMAAELGQRSQPSAITDKLLLARLAAVENALPGTGSDMNSVVILSTMVGALLLSRSTQDPALSTRILETARDWLKQQGSDA